MFSRFAPRAFAALTFAAGLFFSASTVQAQEFDDPNQDRNPWSVRPIRKSDIMYQKSLWLLMDLKEKQNEPFFARSNEITKIIIEATKTGVLRPFQNDSLTTRMTNTDFLENLKIPGADAGVSDADRDMGFEDDWGGGGGGGDWGGGGGDDWGGESDGGDKAPVADEFFPSQINILEIKEDLIFDKRRSRMYHDIQSIKLIIPGELYPTGLDKTLAVFSYKELVDNVFKDNPAAIWYNPYNTAEHRNLADAFDLRLFSAHLKKFSNTKDNMIVDMFGDGKPGLAAAQAQEHWYVEYESNLWSN
jgi:hypothetical protein